MSDLEFDVIDGLYFVTAYADLQSEIELDDDVLKPALKALIDKGWVKVYTSIDQEASLKDLNFEADFQSYFYLASKKGLLMHNS